MEERHHHNRQEKKSKAKKKANRHINRRSKRQQEFKQNGLRRRKRKLNKLVPRIPTHLVCRRKSRCRGKPCAAGRNEGMKERRANKEMKRERRRLCTREPPSALDRSWPSIWTPLSRLHGPMLAPTLAPRFQVLTLTNAFFLRLRDFVLRRGANPYGTHKFSLFFHLLYISPKKRKLQTKNSKKKWLWRFSVAKNWYRHISNIQRVAKKYRMMNKDLYVVSGL
jgi:hypothetical protein